MVLERNAKLTILVSEEEREMLAALAERDGVSSSDYVRTFVRRAYAEAFPSTKKGARHGA